MIDLKNELMVIGNESSKIKSFEVWWRGPGGLYKRIKDVHKFCETHDLEAALTFRAVPVAVSENGTFEEL